MRSRGSKKKAKAPEPELFYPEHIVGIRVREDGVKEYKIKWRGILKCIAYFPGTHFPVEVRVLRLESVQCNVIQAAAFSISLEAQINLVFSLAGYPDADSSWETPEVMYPDVPDAFSSKYFQVNFLLRYD